MQAINCQYYVAICCLLFVYRTYHGYILDKQGAHLMEVNTMLDDQDPSRAYIWYDDFKSPVVAAVIATLGLRTYAELAALTAEELMAAGIEAGEMSLVSGVLHRHSLEMSR